MNTLDLKNRLAVLATMHHKEKVIAPLLAEQAGIEVIVPPGLDTDQFGTFTREIKRRETQVKTALLKAKYALELTGETLAIASEGSFFPDPILPFSLCDREIVLLYEPLNNLEIRGEYLSREVNHQGKTVTSLEQALQFAEKVGFPEQGLVVMTHAQTTLPQEMSKGIRVLDHLIEAIRHTLRSHGGIAYLETDLRAMHNPKRQIAIALATQDLIRKLHQYCPQCQFPGFDVTQTRSGLRCGLCGLPTTMTQSYIYQCQRCHYQEEKPSETPVADPTYCPYCNP
jgi:hypothetical protein